MLEINQILENYPQDMQGFKEEILREYLQFKILQGISNENRASQLSFIGGTAIRIIYGSDRFSEDIDFDNFELSWDQFNTMMAGVQKFLELEGFVVEISPKKKGAYHCDVRFPNLLAQYGLPSQRDQKIRIRVDTAQQGFDYEPDLKVLNRFDVFSGIRVTPIDLLLSMKIEAGLKRKRPKGRDFFDITFLLGMTKPNYAFLEQKSDLPDAEHLRMAMLQRIELLNLEELAKDVQPFLIRKRDIQRIQLFREYWLQANL